MKNIEMNGFKRISKQEARKRFKLGETIRFVPCKCRPDNMQGFYCDVNIYYPGTTFYNLIRSYEIFNCHTNETGRYAACYIKEKI